MSATLLSFTDRLPPEAPVRRDQTLYGAKAMHLYIELALMPDPAPSELIDELVHTTDQRRRHELVDAIARSAP